MITAYPPNPTADGTCLLVFSGPPNVSIQWVVTLGPGSIDPQSESTDSSGLAAAVFTPVTAGDQVDITVTHGT